MTKAGTGRAGKKTPDWHSDPLLLDSLVRVGREKFVLLDHLLDGDPATRPHLACLMIAPVVESLSLAPCVPQPLVNLYPCLSYGVPCGWLFEFPRLSFHFSPSHMTICALNQVKKSAFSHVEQTFVNGRFSIFGSENKSALVTLNRQRLITWENS